MDIILKTEQKQTLSQKMIQSTAILQMTAAQLEQYLDEQALENPVLELIPRQPEEPCSKSLETYQWISSHDEQNRYLYSHLESDDEDPAEWNFPRLTPDSLADVLWEQLLTKTWPSHWEPALHYLLESLDDKGYYTDSLADFAARCQLTEETACEMLSLIQSLEPAGIGARTLEECLCLQLKRRNLLTPELLTFIQDCLPLVAGNRLSSIAGRTGLSMAVIKRWCALIRDLNPKPGAPFTDSRQPSYITPDVIVIQTRTQPELWFNDSALPDITLNSEYLHMFREHQENDVHDYLLRKIQQTQWLRQCIQQRSSTLMSVAQAILVMQQEFFSCGPDSLKPLKQSDIAGYLGIHVSTVSRACSQKYLQCAYGTFPFSYFFPKASARAVPLKEDGSAETTADSADSRICPGPPTARDVKKALAAIIQQEHTAKPYSDRVLAELLTDQGFSISRRTVAKYREEMSVPGISGRKSY